MPPLHTPPDAPVAPSLVLLADTGPRRRPLYDREVPLPATLTPQERRVQNRRFLAIAGLALAGGLALTFSNPPAGELLACPAAFWCGWLVRRSGDARP